jgi:hypothetical protein
VFIDNFMQLHSMSRTGQSIQMVFPKPLPLTLKELEGQSLGRFIIKLTDNTMHNCTKINSQEEYAKLLQTGKAYLWSYGVMTKATKLCPAGIDWAIVQKWDQVIYKPPS